MKQLVIVGTGDFGAIAAKYFERDYKMSVAAFAVEKEFKDKDVFLNKPVIEFTSLRDLYPPNEYMVFIAVVYQKLNRVRMRLYETCKALGYEFASYASPFSFIDDSVSMGENTFVFENNTLQYNVKIGDNCVIWSGNHIGHSSIIKDNCYLSSHICISGHCVIGENSFIGVNAAIGDDIAVPKDTVIAMGAALTSSIKEEGEAYAGVPAKKMKKTAFECFGVSYEN